MMHPHGTGAMGWSMSSSPQGSAAMVIREPPQYSRLHLYVKKDYLTLHACSGTCALWKQTSLAADTDIASYSRRFAQYTYSTCTCQLFSSYYTDMHL